MLTRSSFQRIISRFPNDALFTVENLSDPAATPNPGNPENAGSTPVPPSGPVPASGPGPANANAAPHYTPVPGQKKYRRVGDYDIVSKLGQGAMGSVYLAKQISSGSMVALKILPPDLAKDQELLERFKRESRASQRVEHVNIVSAVDFGTVDKYNYIAMQYVDGPDLETQLKKTGPYPSELVMRVASDMCAALEAIELCGIVHRDIKPSNILMTSTGLFRLTDLGLASASQGDQRLTLAGFAVGTPYYISPEQARGQLDVDIRADIYGLGATLYHLATGVVPFPGTNPVVVMTQHINAPLKPPHEILSDLDRNVSSLIQLMMSKEPDKRPQSSAHLRTAIERCQNGEDPRTTPKKSAKNMAQGTVRVKDQRAKDAQSAQSGDGFQKFVDTAFGILPINARIPALIGTLLFAIAGLVFAIVLLLKAKG